MSVFGFILFHIFLHSDRIRTALISPYSVRMRENADQNNSECGLFLRSVSNMITSLPAVLSNIISINKRRLNCYGKWYTGEVIHVIMLPHPLPPPKNTEKDLPAKGLWIFFSHGWQNINHKSMFCWMYYFLFAYFDVSLSR